jgi:hypothetical protein
MDLHLQILSSRAFNISLSVITAGITSPSPTPLVLLVGGAVLPRSSELLH